MLFRIWCFEKTRIGVSLGPAREGPRGIGLAVELVIDPIVVVVSVGRVGDSVVVVIQILIVRRAIVVVVMTPATLDLHTIADLVGDAFTPTRARRRYRT